jgi:hypothetical protein
VGSRKPHSKNLHSHFSYVSSTKETAKIEDKDTFHFLFIHKSLSYLEGEGEFIYEDPNMHTTQAQAKKS